jgi:Zn-dependent protease
VYDHPEDQRPTNEPTEGEYLPPAQPEQPAAEHRGRPARGIGAAAAGLGLLALKFKGLLLILLKFKFVLFGVKLLAYSWTFLLSLWLYVLFFGWKLAVVLLFVILAHELGHYAAFRAYGLQARLPVFLPFFGAFTAGAIPANLEQDAYIALAGPLTGLGLAAVCYGLGIAFNDQFWYACADISAFLNLFNMIPSPPFDGGRVIGAISPTLWIVGFILFIGVSIVLHVPIIFVALIGLLGFPALRAAWRGEVDPRAATMTNGARVRVSVWYLATLLGLIVIMGQAHGMISTSPRGVL